jgi:spore maturation protein CgeB
MSSKIRFLKSTSNYPGYMKSFLQKHPELNALGYEDSLNIYLNDCNSWADYWKLNLEATGNFECCEIIENAEFLQKKWASENNAAFSEQDWRFDILAAQIEAFRPDVVFLVDLYLDNRMAAQVRKIAPSVKVIIGWDGILWHKPETYSSCDIVLSCVPETVEFYSSRGLVSWYHKFGFETTVLKKLHRERAQHDLTFSGSMVLAENYHFNRLHIIAHISRKVNLNIRAGELPVDWNLFRWRKLRNLMRNGGWRNAYDLHSVGAKNRGPVFGLDMFNELYNSKIVLNTHGDNSIRTAANMRMTEATGVGALLLTDWKENIADLFQPDEEIVTYKTAAEAVDKIRMLLNNDALRAKIAAAGQKRTLREYNYRRRMEDFAGFLYHYI